jgi:hypothetical protein
MKISGYVFDGPDGQEVHPAVIEYHDCRVADYCGIQIAKLAHNPGRAVRELGGLIAKLIRAANFGSGTGQQDQ